MTKISGLSHLDWKAKTLCAATVVSSTLAGISATKDAKIDEIDMTSKQGMELIQKQNASQDANIYHWNNQLSIVENIENGVVATANKVTATVSDAADAVTDHDNAIPLAISSLVELAALALYQKNRKIDWINETKDLRVIEILNPKFIEEETILAESENGEMQNGDITKQSLFMQYAINNLKNAGDGFSVPIQNGKGKVIIKRIADLDIKRDGFKVVKMIEKADKSRVVYDITVLQYPDYDKTLVFHNRMFEYSPDNYDDHNPTNSCALYERKNGKTMPDGPTNNDSAKKFLRLAFGD